MPQQPIQPQQVQPQPGRAVPTAGSKAGGSSRGCVLPVVGGLVVLLIIIIVAAVQGGGSKSHSGRTSSDDIEETTSAERSDGASREADRIKALKERDADECQQIINRLTSEIVNVKTWSGGKSCKMRKTPVSYREYDAVVQGYFSDDAERYAPLEHDYATFTPDEIIKFFECLNAATGGNYRAPSYVEDSDAGDAYGLIEVYDSKRRETMLYAPSGTAFHGDASGSYGSYYFRIATDWD